MKNILRITFLIILISSCTTTKHITKVVDFEESVEDVEVKYKKTIEQIDIEYKDNTPVILFDIFCMPSIILGCSTFEICKAIVYIDVNIPLGLLHGNTSKKEDMFEPIWLPNILKTEAELKRLENKYADSKYIKYKEYSKHSKITTITITRLEEYTYWNTEKKDIKVISQYTFIYADGIKDSVQRVAKKTTLIGDKIGIKLTTAISYPIYALNWFIGREL